MTESAGAPTIGAPGRHFLPAAVRGLAQQHPHGRASARVNGVVLMADMVGFTPTVSRLDGLGRRGHAALTDLLDRSYSAIDLAIVEHGGQTLQRIGDASVAVFAGADTDDVRRRARAAADAIAGLHDEYPEMPSFRVGLAAGDSELLLVPTGDRRLWTLIGDAPAHAAGAQANGEPNSVIEHPSFRTWAATGATIPVEDTSAPSPSFRDLLPRALTNDAAVTDWLGEVRPLSVLFCRITASDGTPITSSDRIVEVVGRLHEVFHRGDASMDMLIWDEKGMQLLSLFGTQADRSPEHAALRAVDTALRAADSSSEIDIALTMGVATGTTVIGAFGDDTHRTFTSLGPTVNLAARLAGIDGISVDAETARLAATGVVYRQYDHDLKGLGVVDVFQPSRHAEVGQQVRAIPGLVARDEELTTIRGLIAATARGESARVAVVSGSPGAGKSTMIAAAIAEAGAEGVAVAEFRGHPILGDAPLRSVTQYLRSGDDAALVDALSLDALFEGTTSTLASGATRASAWSGLRRRLTEVLPDGPLVVVVHDAHWADQPSLEVLREAVADRAGTAVIVEYREASGEVVAWWSMLDDRADVVVIQLDGLDQHGVGALIRHQLGVRTVPDVFVERIARHSAGNPFMVRQLVDAAIESGEIDSVGGLVRLHSTSDVHGALAVPTDVHRVVAGAIDALVPLTALTLKAAATLGVSFTAAEVRELHPMAPTVSDLEPVLAELVERGLLVADGDRYRFGHSITRDVAASLLTPAQHRELHRRVAEMIERTDDPNAVELLAHHWTEADDAARALPYLSKAALRSGPVFAGPHTVRYIDAAQDLASRHRLAVDDITRAQWHIALAESARTAGDLERHHRELARALQLLDLPIPDTVGARLRLIGRAVLRQTRHRLVGTSGPVDQRVHERAIAALTALRVVNINASEQDDALLMMIVALLSLNLAESGGVGPELTSSYGMAEVGSRSFGLRRLADVYGRLVDRAVAAAGPSGVAEAKVHRAHRWLGEGRATEAGRLLDEARDAYDELGSPYIADLVEASAGYADYFDNRLEDARERYRRLGARAAKRGDPRMSGWGANGEAIALLAMGRDEEAQACLDASRDLPGDVVSALARSIGQALIDARSGRDFASAEDSARAAAGALLATPPTFFFLLCQFVFVDEMLRVLRRRAELEAPDRAPGLRRLHRRVLIAFGAYRALFPVGRPSYHAALVASDEFRRPTALSDARLRIDRLRLDRSLRRSSVTPFGATQSPTRSNEP